MVDYLFIVQNKELFKIIYSLVVLAICIMIVVKSDRFFRISSHQGIRYFRNAFFFYGLAFVVRYFLKFIISFPLLIDLSFEFFMIMAGFSLIYSMAWRKFEYHNKGYKSSLFNPVIMIFYSMAIVVVLLDYLLEGFFIMYATQILVFGTASIISYTNYKRDNYSHQFPKFYFIAMVLGFFAWILNSLVAIYFHWDIIALTNLYVLNALFFLIFLYGIVRVTKI